MPNIFNMDNIKSLEGRFCGEDHCASSPMNRCCPEKLSAITELVLIFGENYTLGGRLRNGANTLHCPLIKVDQVCCTLE